MIPLILLLLLGMDGDCPGDGTARELRQAVAAAGVPGVVGDPATQGPWLEAVRARVPCLREVVTPEDALLVHAAMARAAEIRGDAGAAARAWMAVRALPLPDGLPVWLQPPDEEMPLRSAPPDALEVPAGIALFVDGVPTTRRPVDRPALYQAVGASGRVVWTLYVEGDEELPGGITLLEEAADPAAGRELLDRARGLLLDGRWDEALEVALPAASTWPDLEPSFRTVAAIATDQLRRERERDELGLAPGYDPYLRRRNDEDLGKPGPKIGFDAGLPTGLRLEWKFAGRAVDSIGLRVGGNFLVFPYVYPVGDGSIYADFQLPGKWQIEVDLGGILYSGTVYPQAGVAVQYDPITPLQVNIGAKISTYGLLPDVNVGFVW